MRKYLQVNLPPNRAFHFRDRDDQVVAVATNITDLQKILHDCSDGVLQHHAKGRDLSKWVDGVFGDEDLSMALAAIESRLGDREIPVDEARSQYMAVVRSAYPM
jgi:hypothetical protein